MEMLEFVSHSAASNVSSGKTPSFFLQVLFFWPREPVIVYVSYKEAV